MHHLIPSISHLSLSACGIRVLASQQKNQKHASCIMRRVHHTSRPIGEMRVVSILVILNGTSCACCCAASVPIVELAHASTTSPCRCTSQAVSLFSSSSPSPPHDLTGVPHQIFSFRVCSLCNSEERGREHQVLNSAFLHHLTLARLLALFMKRTEPTSSFHTSPCFTSLITISRASSSSVRLLKD